MCPSSPTSGCSTLPNGTGVVDADFVLFVTANSDSSDKCPGASGSTLVRAALLMCARRAIAVDVCLNVLSSSLRPSVPFNSQAFASYCQLDNYDRPLIARANFCPHFIDTNVNTYKQQLDTAIHELAHALGFTSTSLVLFRFVNASSSPHQRGAVGGLTVLWIVVSHSGTHLATHSPRGSPMALLRTASRKLSRAAGRLSRWLFLARMSHKRSPSGVTPHAHRPARNHA